MSETPGSRAPIGREATVSVAVIGFGTAGGGRLSGYGAVPGVEVTAVVDPSPERREQAARLLPHGRVFASYEALAASDATDVDVVDVCAPPVLHAPLTRAALAAGKHVICEKPVAVRGAEARELNALARDRGRLLFPSHNYGTSPLMRTLQQAVGGGSAGPATAGDGAEDGEGAGGVGRLESATFRILRDRHARGVPGFAPDWRRSAELAGGGILLDHGTHCVYMALRLFGRAPGKLSCTVERPGGDPAAVDEAARLRLDFGDGQCDIELSWTSGERSNHYSVSGSAGVLSIDDGEVTGRTRAGEWRRSLVSPSKDQTHLEWFAPMYEDFRRVLAAPGLWDRCAREIEDTARIVEAAYASAAAGGRTVPI
ncbi:gfo/Idh/MocA family oxidoreductase [Streptomyces albofaciens JCM 4342]|uniref:Gfo/Idh/MocA family protein n=1 Tax=Streptomyces albofaciens TaxID=66866 RepID=UPI001239E114|nr:Gfo/Idh/MocA family oxidoreductase [Streptomyces albofaciens]KAA6213145.1 gfo/Idh/MocA family oxidoreductase [Streptomyces albofaciens JCM 4342]